MLLLRTIARSCFKWVAVGLLVLVALLDVLLIVACIELERRRDETD